MPKLAAVVSNSRPLLMPAGRSAQRWLRIRPSIVVHMWQMTYGFILHPGIAWPVSLATCWTCIFTYPILLGRPAAALKDLVSPLRRQRVTREKSNIRNCPGAARCVDHPIGLGGGGQIGPERDRSAVPRLLVINSHQGDAGHDKQLLHCAKVWNGAEAALSLPGKLASSNVSESWRPLEAGRRWEMSCSRAHVSRPRCFCLP